MNPEIMIFVWEKYAYIWNKLLGKGLITFVLCVHNPIKSPNGLFVLKLLGSA